MRQPTISPRWTRKDSAILLAVLTALTLAASWVTVLALGTSYSRRIQVPIGSDVAMLEEYVGSAMLEEGEVTEWAPVQQGRVKPEPAVRNEFGAFDIKGVHEYVNWKQSPAERESFTGQIEVVGKVIDFEDFPASNFIYEYTYINGKLRRISFGRLPG